MPDDLWEELPTTIKTKRKFKLDVASVGALASEFFATVHPKNDNLRARSISYYKECDDGQIIVVVQYSTLANFVGRIG